MRTGFPVVRVAIVIAAAVSAGAFAGDSAAPGSTPSTSPGSDTADIYAVVARNCRPLVDSGQQIGIVVGVIQGERRLVAGFGRRDKDKPGAPDGGTLFELASITKTFTAAVLETMVESGEVRLDAPAETYMPEGIKLPTRDGRVITLEHLITHTSGLANVPDTLDARPLPADPRTEFTLARMGEYLRRVSLVSPPGDEYRYSSTGMGLVGIALTNVRKTNYEKLLRSSVLEPLGMSDTCMTPSGEQRARLATGYAVTRDDGDRFVAEPTCNWSLSECFSGAGGLYSTADDMMKYLAANLGMGDAPLAAALERTQRPRHKTDRGTEVGMAWGVGRNERGKVGVFHGGNTWGYSCFMILSREGRKGVVVLSNSSESVEKLAFDILAQTPHKAEKTVGSGLGQKCLQYRISVGATSVQGRGSVVTGRK